MSLSSVFTSQPHCAGSYCRAMVMFSGRNTLRALRAHLDALKAQGKTLPKLIMENTVHTYGYADLDAAEARLASR